MKIRRVQFNIGFIHILTFREEYKDLFSPYFKFDKLKYAIDNENTIHEAIRLIFPTENIIVNARKDGITFFFEGDVNELKNQNGIIKIYWDLYEGIRKFKAFHKAINHNLVIHAVDIKEPSEIKTILEKNPYFTINPFGKLNEFACVYEYDKENLKCKFSFGNYTPDDINKHDLMPFKTKFNEELINGTGLISRIELTEETLSPSFTKFKTLLTNVENILNSYKF
jgi:hypothetical protein